MKNTRYIVCILMCILSSLAIAADNCPGELMITRSCSHAIGECDSYWQCRGKVCTGCTFSGTPKGMAYMHKEFQDKGLINGVCTIGKRTCVLNSSSN